MDQLMEHALGPIIIACLNADPHSRPSAVKVVEWLKKARAKEKEVETLREKLQVSLKEIEDVRADTQNQIARAAQVADQELQKVILELEQTKLQLDQAKKEADKSRLAVVAAQDAARIVEAESKRLVQSKDNLGQGASSVSGSYKSLKSSSPSNERIGSGSRISAQVRIARTYLAAAREVINHFESNGSTLLFGELNNLKRVVFNIEQFCHWIRVKVEPVCAVRDGKKKNAIVMKKSEITFLTQLGIGQSGIVWKAQYRGKLYACKQLSKSDTKEGQEEARKELKAWESIPRVPHLAPLVGIVMESEMIWGFLTRLCYQGSLEGQKRLNKVDVLRAVNHALIGLRHLHKVELVHRDLARRNLLWDGDRVSLSDFGLARQSDYIWISKPDQRLPWLAYSPEALANSTTTLAFTKEVDVWAFGLLMWELATWQTPFAAESQAMKGNDQALFASIARGDTKLSLHKVAAEIPELVGPILGCIQLKPEDRLTLEQLHLMLEGPDASPGKMEPFSSEEEGGEEW